MEKTIRKAVYSTETAKHLGGKNVGEFGMPDGYEEQLFVTDAGQHFVYGTGGPESPYKKPDIKLLTNEKADAWKKENNL